MYALGVFAVVVLLLASGSTAAPDGAPVVRTLQGALNAHDTDAVMNVFAPGATVQGAREPQNRAQIRGWVEQLIREDVRLELGGQPQDGSTLNWPGRLHLDRFGADGYVDARVQARVADGKIRSLTIRASSPAP